VCVCVFHVAIACVSVYEHVCVRVRVHVCLLILKIYLVFIGPLFEYACEVWDNCIITFSNKLENVQYEAGRIITGLPIYTKKRIYLQRARMEIIDR